MNLTKEVSIKLNNSRKNGWHIENNHLLGLTGRKEIYDLLETILGILFPGRHLSKSKISKISEKKIARDLKKVKSILTRHIKEVLCATKPCKNSDNKKVAIDAVETLISSLPTIRDELIEDIKRAYKGDPAAYNIEEIMLSYPFVEAIATHRIANVLYKKNIPIIPRILSEKAHSSTGIDIHPGANIKPGFFIDHGTGVVIGETCNIGKNVIIYQGVTLGALSPFDKKGIPKRGIKRHPDIEDDVIIYANSTILGGDTVIGKNSIIGGNCWITKSVKPNSVVVYKSTL